MADLKAKISLREFARRVGVSDTYVREAIYNAETNPGGCLMDSVGIHPKNGRPILDYDKAIFEWRVAGKMIKSELGQDNLPPLPKHKDLKDMDAPDVERALDELEARGRLIGNAASGLSKNTDINTALRLKEVYTAGLKELQYQQLLGSLVRKDDVYKILFEYGDEIKNLIMQIPARVAPFLVDKKDEDEIQRYLYKELEAVTMRLSEGPKEEQENESE